VLPLLAFAMFALAVWLSKGRRRQALRTTGWCFVGVGVFVLLDRRLAGNEVINALVKNPSNRPAAHEAWAIASTLLYDIAVAVIVYGLLLVVAAWIAGDTRPARGLRVALAPTLRTRPAAAYGAVYVALLLVVFWGPTPATRQLPYIVAFIVLLALGVDALRRQTAREFPDAQAGDAMRSIGAMFGGRARPDGHAATVPAAGPPRPVRRCAFRVSRVCSFRRAGGAGSVRDPHVSPPTRAFGVVSRQKASPTAIRP
jgi:hypothetical protein